MENDNIQNLLAGMLGETIATAELDDRWQNLIRHILPGARVGAPPTPSPSPSLANPVASPVANPFPSASAPLPVIPPPSPSPSLLSEDIMYELLHEYNRNIRSYQTNMNQIIRLLINSESGSVQVPAQAPTRPPTQAPAQVPTRPPVQVTAQPPAYDSTILSYIFYPTIARTATDDAAPANVLTREEIASTTRTFGFTNGTDTSSNVISHEDSSGAVCPISLEPFQVGDVVCQIQGCGHIFKRPLLMNWLRRSSRCPVCRYQLRNYLNQNNHPSLEPVNMENNIANETDDATATATSPAPAPPTFEYAEGQMLSVPEILRNILAMDTPSSLFDFSSNEIEFEFEFRR